MKFTLKTKACIVFPLAVTIGLLGLLFLIQSTLQGYIKDTISSQQFQIVSNMAEELDANILDAQKPLIALAQKVTPGLLSDPDEAYAFLLERTESTWQFDNGMFLFDDKGRVVAELPLGVSRSGKDLSYRDYMKVTFATKVPHISDPYISSQAHNHPAIMLTVPILDADGNVKGVLGGSIDLSRPNFMGDISRRKVGKTGYMFLFDTNRTMIIHPDSSRVMKQDIPPGANLLLDKAIDGFEGSGETVNSRGMEFLTSFKRLKTKEWIIGSNYSRKEAYHPVEMVRLIFLIGLPLLSIGIFGFMYSYMKRLTTPIMHLASHVEHLHQKTGAERLVTILGEEETAALGLAFNELIKETDRQRERLEDDLEKQEQADRQLRSQNEYLSALQETTLGLIKRLDVTSVLQAIVSRSGRLIGTEHCFLYMVNNAGTALDMVYQSGIYESLIHHPVTIGEGISGRVWLSGESLEVDDYNLWEGRIRNSDRDVLHAMAAVPLKVGESVVGVLGLTFLDKEVHFSEQQMQALEQFGELASLALENARLNEESQRDLAERKRAEENLRKLSVAVEQNPASIVITDLYGTIEYVNPHFTMLTGYSYEEAVGQNPAILKSGETGDAEYKQLWEAILSGGEWRGEFHNRKKNGELYWEQALIAPIRDNSYAITHFIAIKEDITDRKQLEVQLRHAQKMDAVGQLAGGIAHDFNNILTAIIGYASIMQIKLPEESPLKKHAEQIIATADRGAALTQGLLAFSRKQSSNPVVLELNEIINRVHQLLLRLISEDIVLEINPGSSSLPVMVDSGQFEQVLMNLATNARDAMPQGGTVKITTEPFVMDNEFVLANGLGHPGSYALLKFSDSGAGISPEVAKHIFEPFYTTKELGKGTGLGLSIVYGIIKEHNGYILCDSRLGVGTEFQIFLPLINAAPDIVVKNAQEDAFDVACSGDYILLAEDNDTTRMLGREILEEFGYKVIEAVDGADAVDKFLQNEDRIGLVILDVVMPKLNGREVYDAIKGRSPKTQILFCSGYTKDAVVSQGKLEEQMNYLPKPFTPKELLMKIREVLENGQ